MKDYVYLDMNEAINNMMMNGLVQIKIRTQHCFTVFADEQKITLTRVVCSMITTSASVSTWC